MSTDLHYPASWNTLPVSLCHDWLTGMRGGEKVLELIGAGFPSATLYCLLHKPGSVSAAIEKRSVRTSPLQHIPGIYKHYRYFLPAFPLAIRALGTADQEILISTSHCAAKALRKKKGGKHLCYCFTPMRYAWTFHEEYFGRSSVKRALLSPVLRALQRWDGANSKQVDRFVGISRHVQARIENFYKREADVVYPPVDTDFYTPDPAAAREDFDLVVSALVPYKRVDLAVTAYTQSGRKLVVVGTGTEFEKLKASAGANVTFLGWQPDEKIRDLYRTCRFLVFPGEEDFGIVPVEAMACGAPVIAFARGGVTETVQAGRSGLFFEAQNPDTLNQCVKDAENISWSGAAIRTRAEVFSRQNFIHAFAESLDRCLRG